MLGFILLAGLALVVVHCSTSTSPAPHAQPGMALSSMSFPVLSITQKPIAEHILPKELSGPQGISSPTQAQQVYSQAKAHQKLYADWNAFLQRTNMRSDPSTQQQWNALLSANVQGIVPDASYTPATIDTEAKANNFSNLPAQIAAANIYNIGLIGTGTEPTTGTGSEALR